MSDKKEIAMASYRSYSFVEPIGPDEETAANARLIAAACNSYGKHCKNAVKCAEEDLLGDLLEACEYLLLEMTTKFKDVALEEDALRTARAAIAKAKGEAEEEL